MQSINPPSCTSTTPRRTRAKRLPKRSYRKRPRHVPHPPKTERWKMRSQATTSVGTPPPPLREHHGGRGGPNNRLAILLVLYRAGGANLHFVHTLTRIAFPRISLVVEDLEEEGLVRTWQKAGCLDHHYSGPAGALARAARRLDQAVAGPPASVPLWARITWAQLTEAGKKDPQLLEVVDTLRREGTTRARERESGRAPLRTAVRRLAGILRANTPGTRWYHDDDRHQRRPR